MNKEDDPIVTDQKDKQIDKRIQSGNAGYAYFNESLTFNYVVIRFEREGLHEQ